MKLAHEIAAGMLSGSLKSSLQWPPSSNSNGTSLAEWSSRSISAPSTSASASSSASSIASLSPAALDKARLLVPRVWIASDSIDEEFANLPVGVCVAQPESDAKQSASSSNAVTAASASAGSAGAANQPARMVLSTNQAFLQLTGFTRQEFVDLANQTGTFL